MADIPETSEYWAVECDECNEWIAIRPASRINNQLMNPSVPFPEKFTVSGHEHSTFVGSDVRSQFLPHKLNSQLPKTLPR
jgi:hypothetical protein